jgi:hypothetical protein
MTMQDEDYLRVLAAHGANDLNRCFVLKDSRTDAYSVGIFDENDRPFLLMDDDEAFNGNLVQFLLRNNVRVAESVADLTQ